jgi:hypothetical protein
MWFIVALKAWQAVVLTKNMLFLLLLNGWHLVVLSKKSVDCLGIEG